MTSHRVSECRHCGVPYSFQASGHGCNTELNDGTYCPDCKKVVLEALTQVPKKCERRWVDSKEYTLPELEEIEKRNEERAKDNGFPQVRRVFPCLFDMSDHDNHHIVRCVNTPRGTFSYSYWTKETLTKPSIRKEVHWDIINDKEYER